MPFASSIDDGRQPRKATDAVPGLAAGAHRQIDHELAVERHVATHWIGLPRNHDPSVIRSASVSITITWNSLDRLRWRIAILGAFRAAMRWMRDLYCRGSIKLWWIVIIALPIGIALRQQLVQPPLGKAGGGLGDRDFPGPAASAVPRIAD